MDKLMVGVARILPLCALISVFLSGIAVQPAYAKLGPISIRSVYTTDENQNNKNVFMSGDSTDAPAGPDKINYHVDVDNTTASAFPIDIRFQAFANYAAIPHLYNYDQTYRAVQMPVGLSRFYNPTSLPSDAASYWYIVQITITPSGCSGTGCTNDGDLGENTFTIQMTKAPEGKAPNLIVLVHGCCNDAGDVKKDWGWDNGSLGALIKNKIDPNAWEVVVWDWHEKTPKLSPQHLNPFDEAYQAAKIQGGILANAINTRIICTDI